MTPDRRDFLRALAAGAAAASLPGRVFAQGLSSTKLTDKITLITGAGNNILMLASDGGNLLVDSGDAAHAADVLKMAGRVSTVINTHWHTDSTGGNDGMAKAGAKLASHVNTQLWMTQEIMHDWEKKVYPPRDKAALPTETFYTSSQMKAGGEDIECALLPMAHTDGDIYVHFQQQNVLAVGDVVQAGRLPELDWFCGGWLGGMITAHRTILSVANDQTKIVPARGPVMTKAQVQANMDTVTKVRDQLVKLVKQGKGPQNMIDEKAMKDFGDLAGDPNTFIYIAYRGLWLHAREISGVV